MTTGGLDYCDSFTMIEFTDFTDTAKSASRHTTPFTISVLKIRSLKALKFWIEDKLIMREPLLSAAFAHDVLNDYIQLYIAAVAANNDNVELVVGIQLDFVNWDTFVNATGE